MPPVDTSPQSVIRYFTRLLTALTVQAGGELRIPMKVIREVEEETSRQALLEDTNTDTDELVLRFGTKHSAVYPVESEQCASPKLPSATISQPVQLSRPEVPNQRRPPLTDDQILSLQRKVNARVRMIQLKREQAQREKEQEDLSSILEPSSPGSAR